MFVYLVNFIYLFIFTVSVSCILLIDILLNFLKMHQPPPIVFAIDC